MMIPIACLKVTVFHMPMRGWTTVHTSPYIEPLLRQALPLVRAAVQNGHSVLVHCNSGMHRSASIACAILMIERDLSLDEAFRHIIRGRVVCAPSLWQYLLSNSPA